MYEFGPIHTFFEISAESEIKAFELMAIFFWSSEFVLKIELSFAKTKYGSLDTRKVKPDFNSVSL